MRGNDQARDYLDSHPRFRLSAVTYMELVQGMRNKQELMALRRALKKWKAEIIHISEEISSKAVFYVEQHYLSHSVHLADALIAATAVTHGLPLTTGNEKHYTVIEEVDVVRFYPDKRRSD
jgi:hypothetical protein